MYARDKMTGHGFRSMACTLLNEQGLNRDGRDRAAAGARGTGLGACGVQLCGLPAGSPEHDAGVGRLSEWVAGRRGCHRPWLLQSCVNEYGNTIEGQRLAWVGPRYHHRLGRVFVEAGQRPVAPISLARIGIHDNAYATPEFSEMARRDSRRIVLTF